MAPAGPLHPDLLGWGVTIGGAAGLVAWQWSGRGPAARRRALDATVVLATAGAAAVLAALGRLPLEVAAGVVLVLAAGARRSPRRGERPVAAAVALALVAVELLPHDGGPLLLAVLGLLLLTLAPTGPAAPAAGPATPSPSAAAVLPVAGAALAATWVGGPDTEVAVVVGGTAAGATAALLALAIAPWRARTRPTHPDPPVGPPGPDGRAGLWILLVWAAAAGYRGRPGGLWGAVVPLVALAAWQALASRAAPTAPTASTRRRRALGWALAAGLALASGRTVGLDHARGERPALVTLLLVGGVAIAWLGAGPGVRPAAGGGRPPG